MTDSSSIADTAVVGCGMMGRGIALVLALHGYDVVLADRDRETADLGRIDVIRHARELASNDVIPQHAADTVEGVIAAAESIEDAVARADYVTEAAPEKFHLKTQLLARIFTAAPAHAVIATNTSAIPISELAARVPDSTRFLGVHWMNPPLLVPGVELIPSPATSADVLNDVERFIRSLGKRAVRVADSPGFVANRLQFALFKEAARIVDEGLATPAQVDEIVSSSFGFRLALFGPFAIADMAGLDVYESAYRTLEQEFGERFVAPASVSELASRGRLGLKSGGGFRDFEQAEADALLAYRDQAFARLSRLRDDLGPAPAL